MKKFGVFLGIIIVIVGGIYFLSKPQTPTSTSDPTGNTLTDSSVAAPDLKEDDHVRGNPDAKVTIVEYSDFQCPACKSAHDPLAALVDNNIEDVRFVYRHFPLTTIHKYANASAWSSEAAALQGKFWEMHDKLFENQEEWVRSKDPVVHFVSYASELGLDLDKFSIDYDSEGVRARVRRDADESEAIRLTGTPSLFVNGGKYDLALGLAPLQGLVTQLSSMDEQAEAATESGEESLDKSDK
jgi:protein-disulfide isomerase